jgi:hypothetical protein
MNNNAQSRRAAVPLVLYSVGTLPRQADHE